LVHVKTAQIKNRPDNDLAFTGWTAHRAMAPGSALRCASVGNCFTCRYIWTEAVAYLPLERKAVRSGDGSGGNSLCSGLVVDPMEQCAYRPFQNPRSSSLAEVLDAQPIGKGPYAESTPANPWQTYYFRAFSITGPRRYLLDLQRSRHR